MEIPGSTNLIDSSSSAFTELYKLSNDILGEIANPKLIGYLASYLCSLKFFLNKTSVLSNVVTQVTPWEKHLYQNSPQQNGVNFDIELGPKRVQLDPVSIAQSTLTWLSLNSTVFQNQPTDIIIDRGNHGFDSRMKVDYLRSAIRYNDGRYSVVSLNKKTGEFKQYNFQESELSDISAQVYIDMENTTLDLQSSTDIHLSNSKIHGAYVGFSQSEEGSLTASFDHLAMDGVALQNLAATVAMCSDAAEPYHDRTRSIATPISEPMVDLEGIAPLLGELSNTQLMKVYAQSLISIGIPTSSTILVPHIGKFDNPELDQFTVAGNPIQNSRIQPVIIPLEKLAYDTDWVKKHLKQVSQNVNNGILTYLKA